MLIDLVKSFFLGVVEGITEFLPISSTGHLILLNQWVSFDKHFTEFFDIFIQLGAILAVVLFFWKKIWPINIKVWLKIIIAVIPALVIGGLFGDFIRENLFNFWIVALALIVGGLIIIYIEDKNITYKYDSIDGLSWKHAFFIGLIQCLAMIPGTSRSAATIIGALLLGSSRSLAVEFSFFLAIPTLIAASGYSLLKHGLVISGEEILVLIVGFITSFFVALYVIKFLMKYIKNHNFNFFAYYRIILGILILLYFTFGSYLL
jgi:undecaprenyl-diphosphatase